MPAPATLRQLAIGIAIGIGIGITAFTATAIAQSPDPPAALASSQASAVTTSTEPLLTGHALDQHLFPVENAGQLTNTLSLIFNGYRRGMIEPCGCVDHRLGGIDKEARLAARVRELSIPLVQVDAGGFIKEPAAAQARALTRLQLMALQSMKLDAVNVSFHDLGFGLGYLRDAQTSFSLPFTSCNVVDATSTPLFEPVHRIRVELKNGSSVRVGVIGATRFRTSLASSAVAGGFAVIDPVAAIRRYLPPLRRESDVIVLLNYDTREETGELLRTLGADARIDIAIAGESAGKLATPSEENGTWLVSGGFEGRQVGHMMLQFDKSKLITAATSMVEVLQTLPPVPEYSKLVHEAENLHQ
jgi:2',3'-cyclic-nucleotide 2'-phosphodiesterase (5'-nucleotidase family)